ncbi:FemAB family XrtA/PEP-CTERM system-associated protein [Motilimonas sp. KMU-193]|uniref:FemAB family XrtA/PEP-CTERM system-associated protein n=1 Tax=Motilimonas sp. KMU-193 TaxID=3388668 RepID=UPI00396B2246
MQLKLLTPDMRKQWDEFVLSHPEGEFFHLSGWQQIFEQVYHHPCWFYYVEEQGRILGILPLTQIKSWLFGNKLISLPFSVCAGVLSIDPDATQLLLWQAKSLGESLNVDCIELRHRRETLPDWLTKPSHENFACELAASPEQILAGIKKKQRAVVRQSLANGLNYQIETNIEPFYSIYSESVRNLGTPVFAKAYFEALLQTFPEYIDILTVSSQGKPVSSVMSFYFKHQVMPFYGGGTPLARDLKSNDYMYYQLMCHGAQQGMVKFDFGRSKLGSGAHAYKKHWGMAAQPLFYESYLVKGQELPNISPNNPKYQLFIKAWKKLPLPISRALGPVLAKDLG